MKAKIEHKQIKIQTNCQACGKLKWFKFQARGGYICPPCKRNMPKTPYWYIVCEKCRRVFFIHKSGACAKTCASCTFTLWKPKRKKRALRVANLLDGEMFYCLEYPDMVFMKYAGQIVRHAGPSARFDLKVIESTPNLYKYIY